MEPVSVIRNVYGTLARNWNGLSDDDIIGALPFVKQDEIELFRRPLVDRNWRELFLRLMKHPRVMASPM